MADSPRRFDIMLYTHSFAGGGAERVMIQLANHWAAKGYATAFAVNLDAGPLRAELTPDVAVFSLGKRRGLLALVGLARLLSRHRPRAVASGITTQNVVASLANLLAGRRSRLLVTEHTYLSSRPDGGETLHWRLLLRLVRLAYPFADIVSAVSVASARDLDRRLSRPPGSTAVLYNPIWPPPVTPGVALGDVHPWFAGPDPVILSVGRLAQQKNHRNLIDALAVARRTRPVRAIVIGEGELRPALLAHAAARGVADAIDFPGFKRNVGDYLSAAKLFVLSSDGEGLPLALMEAMYMGTPVVSTNCPSGPDELLENGAYGALVPVRDPEALGAAILAALDTEHDRDRLRRRAAEFTIDATTRRYEALLFPDGAPKG